MKKTEKTIIQQVNYEYEQALPELGCRISLRLEKEISELNRRVSSLMFSMTEEMAQAAGYIMRGEILTEFDAIGLFSTIGDYYKLVSECYHMLALIAHARGKPDKEMEEITWMFTDN